MKKNNLDLQIRQRIDSLLGDISVLVKTSALDAVRNALGAVESTAQAASAAIAPAPVTRQTRSKRGKRTSEQVDAMAATILAYVKNNGGQRLEQIGKAMKTPTKEMKLPIQKLLGARALRMEGKKRGTKYFAGGSPAVKAAPKKAAPARKAKAHKKA
jgi:hypothetical protein